MYFIACSDQPRRVGLSALPLAGSPPERDCLEASLAGCAGRAACVPPPQPNNAVVHGLISCHRPAKHGARPGAAPPWRQRPIRPMRCALLCSSAARPIGPAGERKRRGCQSWKMENGTAITAISVPAFGSPACGAHRAPCLPPAPACPGLPLTWTGVNPSGNARADTRAPLEPLERSRKAGRGRPEGPLGPWARGTPALPRPRVRRACE